MKRESGKDGISRRQLLKRAGIGAGIMALSNISIAKSGQQQKVEKHDAVLQNRIRKIDFYAHFSFVRLIDFLDKSGGPRPHVFRQLFSNTPTLIDVDQRLRHMDKYGIEADVLVPLPWLETAPSVHADPKLAAKAAKIFNGDLAKVVSQYPDRFFGVALLPTTNPEVMMSEFESAVKDLGFAGGVIAVGPTVKRPDHKDYEPLYRRAVELDVPLWLHPSRPLNYPDYIDEKVSKYQVWQGFGWLMDSSTAMVRIVFSGIFQRYPNLKLVIHHHGALVPLFSKRLESGWDFFEHSGGVKEATQILRPYINHFKNFYCDTATQGFEPLLLQLAYEFFGVDHILFGTDTPMDAKAGGVHTPETDRCVGALNISEADKKKIYNGNALRLLKRT